VEAHGGSIAVSCRDEGGTTFRVELPAHLEAGNRVPEGELVA
jgi:signal transduction histidine kinase